MRLSLPKTEVTVYSRIPKWQDVIVYIFFFSNHVIPEVYSHFDVCLAIFYMLHVHCTDYCHSHVNWNCKGKVVTNVASTCDPTQLLYLYAINIIKLTDYSAKQQDTDMQLFQVDGIDLPYNKTPKLLGITLDERLDFKSHIANIEANPKRP